MELTLSLFYIFISLFIVIPLTVFSCASEEDEDDNRGKKKSVAPLKGINAVYLSKTLYKQFDSFFLLLRLIPYSQQSERGSSKTERPIQSSWRKDTIERECGEEGGSATYCPAGGLQHLIAQ